MRHLVAVLLLGAVATPLWGQCRQHAELLSPSDLATEYETTEEWIGRNHRVNVWATQTPDGKWPVVGKLLPGSRAVIIEEVPEDYKIRSPLDGSVGWVNKVQVRQTLYQDEESREPCTP